MAGLVIGHTRMGSFTSSIISFGLLACLNILILVHDPQFAASVVAQCDNIGKAMIVAVQHIPPMLRRLFGKGDGMI